MPPEKTWNGNMECWPTFGLVSLKFDIERPDHLAPLLGFVGDELAEIGGRQRKWRVAKLGDVLRNPGVGAPRNTPAEIIDKLNREINAALADPKMKARLADLGGTGLPGSPADFGKLIADETEKWGKVIRAAGIKAE